MTTENNHVARNMAWPAIADFPEGLILLDTSNRITFMNSVAQKTFNISEPGERIINVKQLFSKPKEAERLLAHLHDSGRCSFDECSFVSGVGAEIVTSLNASVLQDEHGTKLGVLCLIGLTSGGRLRDYASKLESKIKELDQFAYIISHDLKAPLRAIGNLTSWIQEDLEGALTGDSKQNMDLLLGRVNRMEALINGVLEYSRIGRIEVKAELVDLRTLLEELVELLTPPSHVTLMVDPNMPSIITRGILLSQVFSNLISNAIKYNDKQQAIIKVGFAPIEGAFEFFIEDNGPGIAKEHHEKIFVIFQTLQSRDKFESTGIGLTIVKRIVEEQGGTIRVESTVGTGSKFIFTWPVGAEPDYNMQ